MDSFLPSLPAAAPDPDPQSPMGMGCGEKSSPPHQAKEVAPSPAGQTGDAPAVGERTDRVPYHTVGFAPRLIAFMVDIMVITMLAVIFTLGGAVAYMQGEGSGEGPPSFLDAPDWYMPLFFTSFILVSLIYFTHFHGVTGQTAGKSLLGLRVVGETGKPLGYRRALGRCIGSSFSMTFFTLGFLWILVDRRKQGWHDKIAGSLVIWS